MARRSSRLVQLEEEQEKAESARKEDNKHNNNDRKKKNKRKKQDDSDDDDDDDEDDDDEETVESTQNHLTGSLPGGRRTWEESFAALVKFKKKTGHCIVPSAYDEDTALGHWVRKQRRYEATGVLEPWKTKKLNKMGFVWKLRGEDGKPVTKPPSKPAPKPRVRITAKIDKPEPPKRTASSNSKTKARAVRESKRVKLLQSEMAKRQEEEEEASDDEEEIEIQKAKKRKKDKKRNNARDRAKEKKPRKERKTKRRVSIASAGDDDSDDDERRQGETLTERWHQNFKRLKKFHRAHGHCQVARKQDKTLSYWVSRQRQLNYSQQLRVERRELLDSLNFEWYMNSDVPEHYFDEMLGRLKEFRQEFGHVQVPTRYMRGGLGEWVEGLRSQGREGFLDAGDAAQLLRVGFTWSEVRDSWLKNFDEVSDEVETCRDKGFKKRLSLSSEVDNWLKIQFMLSEYDLLPPKRQTAIESLGVAWDGSSLSWAKRDNLWRNREDFSWLSSEPSAGHFLKTAALAWTPRITCGRGKKRVIEKSSSVTPESVAGHMPESPKRTLESDKKNAEGGNSNVGDDREPAKKKAKVDAQGESSSAKLDPPQRETTMDVDKAPAPKEPNSNDCTRTPGTAEAAVVSQ